MPCCTITVVIHAIKDNYTEDFNAIIFTPRSLWENCCQIRAQIQSFNLGINQSPDPVTK